MVSSLRIPRVQLLGPSPPPRGSLLVFKLSESLKAQQLPEWLQEQIPPSSTGRSLRYHVSKELLRHLARWISEKPWAIVQFSSQEQYYRQSQSRGEMGLPFVEKRNAASIPRDIRSRDSVEPDIRSRRPTGTDRRFLWRHRTDRGGSRQIPMQSNFLRCERSCDNRRAPHLPIYRLRPAKEYADLMRAASQVRSC